jgi:hypothetical protein
MVAATDLVKIRFPRPRPDQRAAIPHAPQEAKKKPWPLWRLIATVGKLEIESTYSKRGTLHFSNRNKNGVSGELNPFLHPFDDCGDALAYAYAHGAEGVAGFNGVQLIHGGGEEAGAAGA